MHIDAIDLYRLRLPLRQRLPGPSGRYETFETVLVALTADGVTGWGEASPGNAPLHGPEWTDATYACLRDWLAPAVVGADVTDGDALAELLEPFRGNRYAKAALDMALWDARARQQGKPLHELISGTNHAIEVGLTFDQVESHELFLESLGAAWAAGFRRLKLKMRPGWEIHMLEAVRREFPAETLSVDYEGALTLAYSEILYRLDDFSLVLIEQPLWRDELVGHAMLQEALRTPISLDESITMPSHADMAFDLKSCRFMNLKPGRLGGLTAALAVYQRSHDNCTPCYVGAMPQTTIATRFGLALAAKENCSHPADHFPAEQYLEHDVAEQLLPVKGDDGVQRVALWSEPGIGVAPEAAVLERLTVDKIHVVAK